jgi:hypothetical protein
LGAPTVHPMDQGMLKKAALKEVQSKEFILAVSSQLPSKISLSLRGLWEIDIPWITVIRIRSMGYLTCPR